MTIIGPEPTRTRPLHDNARRDLREPGRARPVRLYVWEPPRPVAEPAPLVLVSHGTGGSGGAMEWLVGPLVEAGFRVAAVDHHGNNHVDGYEPEGFCFLWERPRDLSYVLDVLAAERPLGPVGAAGFSLGGYTVAALAGARLDPLVVRALVEGHAPLPVVPEFPGLQEALLRMAAEWSPEELDALLAAAAADLSDPRVRAVFQVAPSNGGILTAESLRAVRVPVEVRWGGADTIAPYEPDTGPYMEHIPGARGRSVGPAVRHDDFIEPEPADPTARVRVGADAVGFFLRELL
ncbi:alpha/beta hydrolase family protein [Streptomyces sp. NPDC058739]|uniref:alpha/beta hydrolase family protein n=1 Tax=Streptomyces sp. NPDC058739 TaxID=3346618 RepID=UPI0036834382